MRPGNKVDVPDGDGREIETPSSNLEGIDSQAGGQRIEQASPIPLVTQNEMDSYNANNEQDSHNLDTSHFRTAIALAALTQLLVAPWESAKTHQPNQQPSQHPQPEHELQPNPSLRFDQYTPQGFDLSQVLRSMQEVCDLAGQYLDLHHKLVESLSKSSQQEISEKNLITILGTDDYIRYKDNIELIEEQFRGLTDNIQVADIAFGNRSSGMSSSNSHPGAGATDDTESLRREYHESLNAMKELGSPDGTTKRSNVCFSPPKQAVYLAYNALPQELTFSLSVIGGIRHTSPHESAAVKHREI